MGLFHFINLVEYFIIVYKFIKYTVMEMIYSANVGSGKYYWNLI